MCDATASPLTRVIESATCRGDIPGSIMGIHRGVYWPRMMLEDCHYGCPNAETALAPLRALLYRIVLPRTSSFVKEYGRSPAQEFQWIKVRSVRPFTGMPRGATQYVASMSSFRQIPRFMCMFSVSNVRSTFRVSNHTYFVNKGIYFYVSYFN